MIPSINFNPWENLWGDSSLTEKEPDKEEKCACGCEFRWHALVRPGKCRVCDDCSGW